MTFPDGFLWGAATSSYQIEGATGEDGRGESIWDRFCKTPGNIADGSDGSIACDHYHRFEGDVALMRELGLGAYRFSMAWPRIFPTGSGPVNDKGLDFYKRLCDALIAAKIEPFCTLYHWDLPQALEDEGGWRSRSTAQRFADYAHEVSLALSDRVKFWITHNEPWCTAVLGHKRGIHAPGIKDHAASLIAAHHVLLSHGLALPAIRANVPGAEVGAALNLTQAMPASDRPEDIDAFRRLDGTYNRWFLDPLHGRGYPGDILRDLKRRDVAFELAEADLDVIATPADFLGINYYTRSVCHDRAREGPPAEREQTEMGWEVYPEGLYQVLLRVHLDYRPRRIFITENGASYSDGPDGSGTVDDQRRIQYLKSHVEKAADALRAGVPLVGYFAWSLLDNFEWGHGYAQRFGMIYVDYATQHRIPKQSARWYRDLIARNGGSDAC
jgi:beta-glucosidase